MTSLFHLVSRSESARSQDAARTCLPPCSKRLISHCGEKIRCFRWKWWKCLGKDVCVWGGSPGVGHDDDVNDGGGGDDQEDCDGCGDEYDEPC